MWVPFMSPLAPAFLDGSVERAEVTDLYPWMEYQFRIFATNEYGSGEASIPSLKIKTWDACKGKMLIFDMFKSNIKTSQVWGKTPIDDVFSSQLQSCLPLM